MTRRDCLLDPVDALRVYMARTEQLRALAPQSPVLLSLKAPFHALQVDTVSGILIDAITLLYFTTNLESVVSSKTIVNPGSI